MKIKQINFGMIDQLKEASMSVLLFMRPLGCKLYRVVGLPEVGDKSTELFQVLNTLCYKRKDGIWYFKIPDQDTMMDIGITFMMMGIEHAFAEPDEVFYN